MKTMYKYLSMVMVALLFAGCFEHEPQVEELPQEAVSFTYLIPGDYPLDYYVDSDIQFTSTSAAEGTATWDFGDNSEPVTGEVVTHAYTVAATYYVKLTITKADGSQVSKTQPLMISDIKPLVSINPIEGGLCEVRTTPVAFSVELPNPKGRAEEFIWTFPVGTTWADGSAIEGGQYKSSKWQLPQSVKFAKVGSQRVRLQASLDGRVLEEAALNVQVAYFEEVPTLYYAVKGGNIMAIKLADNDSIEIEPFDLGISSGQHPFNLLFADTTLYVLDAGKQFYYVDDADGNMGDGKISAIAKDGSKVETVISNVGQAAFDDPFYGFIEDGILYYSNRNTGIVAMDARDRNKVYNSTDYPWMAQNATLNWYGNGYNYGAITGTIAKIDGVWYWSKFYQGQGIFPFTQNDVLEKAVSGAGDASKLPNGGKIGFSGMYPKSFAYNSLTKEFFFTVFDPGFHGLYRLEGIDQIYAISATNKATALGQYEITHENGGKFEFNISGGTAGPSEGTSSEPVAICQMAINNENGHVYFGYRSAPSSSVPVGLMRYIPGENGAKGTVKTFLEGVEVYGVVINQTKSKLF